MATHGTATISQFAELNAIMTRALPKSIEGLDISELLRRYQNNGEELSRVLRVALAKGPQQTQAGDKPAAPTKPQPSHKDIRIKRVIGGKEIVFVGFIREDDTDGYVLGDTMMKRIQDTGFVPLNDSGHLEAHRDEWVDDPELALFYVVTDERPPGNSSAVCCFNRGHRERYWRNLDFRFYRRDLVACRAQ
jgi:hypothetical protein